MKNPTIRTILVPLDFSPMSLNALHHAEQLAKLSKASIVLLHVVKPYRDAIGTSGMLSAASRFEKKLRKESAAKLTTIAAEVKKRTKRTVRTRALIGSIGSTITKVASRTRASIIIMGTHGTSGFLNDMLGSNTYKVASTSKVPVMGVHEKAGVDGYDNIIFPVRANVRVTAKLPYAITFAKLYNAKVHIVGLTAQGNATELDEIRTLCATVRKQFTARKINAKTGFASEEQFASATIRYAQSYANPLIVISQDHDFQLAEIFSGTFSKRILQKFFSPVLTVPGRK